MLLTSVLHDDILSYRHAYRRGAYSIAEYHHGCTVGIVSVISIFYQTSMRWNLGLIQKFSTPGQGQFSAECFWEHWVGGSVCDFTFSNKPSVLTLLPGDRGTGLCGGHHM